MTGLEQGPAWSSSPVAPATCGSRPKHDLENKTKRCNGDADVATLRGLLALPVGEVDVAGRIQAFHIALVDDGEDAADAAATRTE